MHKGCHGSQLGFTPAFCSSFLLVQPVHSLSHLYLILNPALYDFIFFSLAILLLLKKNSFQLVIVCLILKQPEQSRALWLLLPQGFIEWSCCFTAQGSDAFVWTGLCCCHLVFTFHINCSFQEVKKWLATLLLDFSISLKGRFCGDYLPLYLSSCFSELNLNLFPLHISKLLLSPVISLPTQTFTLPLSLRFLVGKVLVWK